MDIGSYYLYDILYDILPEFLPIGELNRPVSCCKPGVRTGTDLLPGIRAPDG